MLEQLLKSITSLVTSFSEKSKKGDETFPGQPQIKIEPRIEAMFRAGIRDKVRRCAIREIVVHGTAGGSTMASLINWMLSGEQAANYNHGIGLFHYAIGRDGEIVQIIDPKYWVYHSLSGAHDQETIGIELLNPTRDNAGPYTKAQYLALSDLIDYFAWTHQTCSQIVSHNHNGITYSRIGKNCPGNFDWPRLAASLEKRGWAVKHTAAEVIHVS